MTYIQLLTFKLLPYINAEHQDTQAEAQSALGTFRWINRHCKERHRCIFVPLRTLAQMD